MKTYPILAFAAVSALTSCSSPPPPPVQDTIAAPAGVPRVVAEFNLASKVAMHGYDPVSYWPEGGGKPVEGDVSRATDYGGAIYLFASDANLATFKQNPGKYEPAHGGWCSYAMKDGAEVDVDPKTFLLRDGRLFLFYNQGGTDTCALWQEGDHQAQLQKADEYWLKLQK